ncbi:hypothetical protein [Streptomyces clavifer]|uniref:hypothetical protein n=1 Tax=Streptomyces clavifer TaxID=68188 RepID=UPI0036AB8E29
MNRVASGSTFLDFATGTGSTVQDSSENPVPVADAHPVPVADAQHSRWSLVSQT